MTFKLLFSFFTKDTNAVSVEKVSCSTCIGNILCARVVAAFDLRSHAAISTLAHNMMFPILVEQYTILYLHDL